MRRRTASPGRCPPASYLELLGAAGMLRGPPKYAGQAVRQHDGIPVGEFLEKSVEHWVKG